MSPMRIVVLTSLVVFGGGALLLLQRRAPPADPSADAVVDLVGRAQRSVTRVPMAITRVSDEEERQVGASIVAHVVATDVPKDGGVPLVAYVNAVGQRVVAHASRHGFPYEFHVVDGMVNAFALPGGHVVVGVGIIRLCQSEDELAALIGHEVAHVDRRHAIERLQYELAARNVGLGAVYQLADPFVHLFQIGYSSEQELEADRVGLAMAVAAGYAPAGGPGLLTRIESLRPAAERRAASTPIGELTSVARDALSDYFATHPPTSERISALEAEIARRRWDTTRPMTPIKRGVLPPRP